MTPGRLAAAFLLSIAMPAAAQDAPTIDTEDASLGSAEVGAGTFRPILALDIRNGDFARGNYDDDAADLDRVPVHVQLGFAWDLHRDVEGRADAFLIFNSSNGLHAPTRDERAAPRAWYESNNVLGLVISPAKDLRAGLAYTIKTSPNGVSPTAHELSFTTALDGDAGFATVNPSASVTWRPKGGGGLFTQIGIEPSIAVTARANGPALTLPARIGTGWDGFYAPGTSDVAYGAIGAAYSHPFEAGGAKWRLRAEALAIVRDDTLRRLGGPAAERGTVVPLATVSLQIAY